MEVLAAFLREWDVLDVAFPPPAPGSAVYRQLVAGAWSGISELLRSGYRRRAAAILACLDADARSRVVCPGCGQPTPPP